MPDNNVANPAAQMPSVQEMEAQVVQASQAGSIPVPQPKGSLINESQKLQIEQATQEQAVQSGIALANTPEDDEPVVETKEQIQMADFMSKARRWSVKGIGIALTLQGLHGIYKSVIFILVEYPILERQLVAHQVTQSQVNDFGIKAIMMVISTVLSMFFAMKLTFLKTKAAKTLNTVIAILLFIGNAMIHDYFIALNSSQIMVDFIISITDKVMGAPEEVIENTPFLEETIEGTIDTVWYK
jgi:hypothetical protein